MYFFCIMMIPSELTTSPSIPQEQRDLVRRAIRMEIFLWAWIFICYTTIFYVIAYIIILEKSMDIVSLVYIYILTCASFSIILYYNAKIRYRAYYITLTWNQRITPEEVQNVLHRKHNINREQMLEFDEEENNREQFCFCMEEKENAEFVKLNCNHIFHTECLAQWLVNNNSCPNCRETNIITRNDFN